MNAVLTAEDLLRREASGLAVEDILALCYSLQQQKQEQQRERLRFYLDVLRRRGGERAQFASTLICFDLARQGDAAAQRDFAFLADTMRSLAAKGDLVRDLVSGDPYLTHVWDLCAAELADMDLQFDEVAAAPREAAAIELLTDDDFAEELPDFALGVDAAAMRHRFEEALEAFFGEVPGVPVFDAEAGFRMRNGRDAERVETFLRELDSLRDFVPAARGYRALTLLFYGTHIRARNFFGVVNGRKQELLRAGIAEFVASGPLLARVAGVLSPIHADPDVWPRIVAVLSDYLASCARDPQAAELGPSSYDAASRLKSRDGGRGRARRS